MFIVIAIIAFGILVGIHEFGTSSRPRAWASR